MEPIKIQIDVQVNFSTDVQKFIKSLFFNDMIEAPTQEAKPAPTQEAKPAPTQETKPKAESAKAKPAESSAAAIDIEMVRAALTKKVNAHRPEIKEKLTELGAPSVTKLDPAKYQEMYNFLESLS